MYLLKHRDSFGKSENLPKIFFTEILVLYPHYECKSSSSNNNYLNNLFWIILELFGGPPKNLHTLYIILCKVFIIKLLIYLQFKMWNLYGNALQSVLSNVKQVLFFEIFFTKTIFVL